MFNYSYDKIYAFQKYLIETDSSFLIFTSSCFSTSLYISSLIISKMCEHIINGLLFNNRYYIPSEILSLILSNVDVKTLYKHCTLVCKLWNAIIKECVCKIKCEQELRKDNENKYKLQWLREKQYPYYVYQIISVSNKSFYKNLIRNPCGMERFNYWILDTERRMNNFTIEDCTLFDNNICKIDDELISSNVTKCFTIRNCELGGRLQIIDLYKYGLTQQFIDEYQPPIYVSEWYGCRRDNVTCIYILYAILLDANYEEMDGCNCYYSFHGNNDRGRFGSFQKVCINFKF